jgi:glycosyltransferase involved in cell wall biosynthesis
MKKIEIIYNIPYYNGFIKKDEILLRNIYNLDTFNFQYKLKYLIIRSFICQFIFLLKNYSNLKIIISQFAGYHTLLPTIYCKLFSIQHIIILHGFECSSYPEFNYGCKRRKSLYSSMKYSIENANLICPVSEALVRFCQSYYNETTYKIQGINFFYNVAMNNIKVVNNGVDINKFKLINKNPRSNVFLTVVNDLSTQHKRVLKGVDLIIEVAQYFTDCEFHIIGNNFHGIQTKSNNIKFIGYVSNENLVNYYNYAKYYMQLSITEGFGLALCESMRCGCIPIVSNVGILKEIAGVHGNVLHNRSIINLKDLLLKILSYQYNSDVVSAISSSVEKYSLERRQISLVRVIKDLLG